MASETTQHATDKGKPPAKHSELLETGLNLLSQGFGIFDRDLRLVTCNARFYQLRRYPPELCRPGTPIDEFFRFNAKRGDYGSGDVETHVRAWVERVRTLDAHVVELNLFEEKTLSVDFHSLPQGGLLVAYSDVTEQRRDERALRKSEERYALVADAAEEGIYEWFIETDEIYVSPRLDKFFKFEVGELGPKEWHWNDRIHPDDLEHYKNTLATHLEGRTNRWECEYRFRDKIGRYCWIFDHGSTVRNEDGKAIRLVGAIRDVTKRKEAEDALRESEARYQLAIRAINEGVYDWNIATDKIYYSSRVHAVLGLVAEKLKTAEDWLNRIHPQDLRIYKDALVVHFKGKTERFECDYRFRADDGSWRWARQHGLALRDNAGRAYRMVGSTGDITELKQHEKELAEKTAILEVILEKMDQGISMVDRDLNVIAFNRKFLELLAFPPDLFKIGFHMEQAFRYNAERGEYGEGDVEQQVRERLELAKRFEPHAFERTRPDGTVLEIRGNPVTGGGFVTTYTDVTERRQAEEALRESEERYALATQAATEGIYEWNIEENTLYLSERAKEIFAFSETKLTPEAWNTRVHPDDFSAYRDALIGHFKGQTGHHECEYRIHDKAGHYLWVLDRGVAVRNDAGRAVRFVGAVSDITARKQAAIEMERMQNELREQNARLQKEIEAHRRSKATIQYLREEIETKHNFEQMVGASTALGKLLDQLQLVAGTDSTVLIEGETGTGKELIARAIHNRSARSQHPLVKVNCAALPRELVESELFGHEKGAFTGATQQRKGRFELADKGTIFLDEVGELPPEAQAKLLRILQEQEFERVGGTRSIRTDVRVIAATNKDLASAVEKGGFRSDLFYRLNVFPLTVPPLRDRRSDIPVLAQHFLEKAGSNLGKHFEGLAPDSLAELMRYTWPGNVRELENVIERAAILSPGPLLEIESLSASPRETASSSTLDDVERAHILSVLEETGWVIEGERGAATALGLNPSTLRGRLRKLGIKKPR